MPDVIENLVELLGNLFCGDYGVNGCDSCKYNTEVMCSAYACADNLIANGVTIQRWIPVTEPPKKKGCYFVTVLHWVDGKPVTREAYWNGADWLSCERRHEITPRVTHWIPLPEPPKGQ